MWCTLSVKTKQTTSTHIRDFEEHGLHTVFAHPLSWFPSPSWRHNRRNPTLGWEVRCLLFFCPFRQHLADTLTGQLTSHNCALHSEVLLTIESVHNKTAVAIGDPMLLSSKCHCVEVKTRIWQSQELLLHVRQVSRRFLALHSNPFSSFPATACRRQLLPLETFCFCCTLLSSDKSYCLSAPHGNLWLDCCLCWHTAVIAWFRAPRDRLKRVQGEWAHGWHISNSSDG